MLTQRTFHIYFCFPSRHLLLTPPAPIFLTTQGTGNRAGTELNPGSTTLSVIPFPIPVSGSITRESLITEAALNLLHYGTISYFKPVPFQFCKSCVQVGAEPLSMPLLLYQQPSQSTRSDPLAAVIIMILLIPPGKLWPQSCLS